MVGRIVGLVICALVLYGVAPAVLDVLDEWPQGGRTSSRTGSPP